jgi:hypothetical protein
MAAVYMESGRFTCQELNFHIGNAKVELVIEAGGHSPPYELKPLTEAVSVATQ